MSKENGVQYCVNCEVVECTELLCDDCLNEVIDDMAQEFVEQEYVEKGLY